MNHQHWSNYWQNGMQTSLPRDFKHNYDGEIYDFWQQTIRNLPDGSRVLDICTGNGAVALIVAEIATQQNKNFKITAVDISQINTEYIKQSNPSSNVDMIDFVSGRSAESIDTLIKQPQDIIVSQFGIEYSDLTLSAPALAKIIKPQGRFVFIAHSATSDVFKYMSKEELIYEWLKKVGLWSLFQQFANEEIDPEQLVSKLHQIIVKNQPNPSFQEQPLFQSWLQLIGKIRQSNHHQLVTQKAAISHFVSEHWAARKRQQDMLDVAKKITDKNWYQPVLEAGFEFVEGKELKYKYKHDIGFYYEFIYST